MSAADRRALLRRTARDYEGPLTTRMVMNLYQAHGLNIPSRTTARNDLAYLARQGLLTGRGPENGRHYTFNRWTGVNP